MAEIVVIIINYGTADMALHSVESVFAREHGSRTIEVHLVDNASPTNDAEYIAEAIAVRGWEDKLVFHAELENHGFGRGNNIVLETLAARTKPPDYVFLLNPDARLKTNTITELAEFLDIHPDTAVVGAGIDGPDGRAVTAAFRFPGVISEFESAICMSPISRLTRHWIVHLPPDTPMQKVDWVSGAAFMVRFTALAEAGFFDPEFFLYYEEVELMYRLRKAGWQIWIFPEARVEHIAGAATGVSWSPQQAFPDYWYDSWRHYFYKTHGHWGSRLCAVARLSGIALHLMISRVRGRSPNHAQSFLSDFYRLSARPLFRRHAR